MSLRDFWLRITSTRYTRALEDEVLLLRAENRALLNSILGIAGVPPILALPGDPPAPETRGRSEGMRVRESASGGSNPAFRQGPASKSNLGVPAGNGGNSKLAAPMRRRSWQQINRMLEFESGLKKREP